MTHARHATQSHRPLRALSGLGSLAGSVVGSLVTIALALGAVVLLAGAYAIVALHVSTQTVLTGSMRGTYDPGALVLTRPEPLTQVQVGDVIVFTPPGHDTPYTHRVVTVKGDAEHRVVTTKGDANPTPDSWQAELHGTTVPRVFGHIPAVGGWLLVVQSRGIRLPLLAFLGLVIALSGTRLIVGSSRPRTTRSTRTPTPTRPANVIVLPPSQGALPCPSTPLPLPPAAMPAPLPLPRSESLPLPSPERASTPV